MESLTRLEFGKGYAKQYEGVVINTTNMSYVEILVVGYRVVERIERLKTANLNFPHLVHHPKNMLIYTDLVALLITLTQMAFEEERKVDLMKMLTVIGKERLN